MLIQAVLRDRVELATSLFLYVLLFSDVLLFSAVVGLASLLCCTCNAFFADACARQAMVWRGKGHGAVLVLTRVCRF